MIGQTYYGTIIPTDGDLGPNSGFITITEAVTNYVPSSTGIMEVPIQMELEVFPNPAADQVNFMLKSNDFTTVLKGEIYNQNGQLITSGEVSTNRNYGFLTRDYSAGTYFLKIYNDKQSFSSKFIVVR